MAQVVECLPRKYKAKSNPSTTKKGRKRRGKRGNVTTRAQDILIGKINDIHEIIKYHNMAGRVAQVAVPA
jgi:hypothetical protein